MKKITFCLIVIFIACSALPVLAQNKFDKRSVAGSWMGTINAGAVSIRVIFNLTPEGNDILMATMDSPDQGAKNIKLGPVEVSNDSIRIPAPMILGIYTGAIRNDTLMEGIWKQAGQSIPLNLTRLKKEFTLNRPQEPKPPFSYSEEEVVFHNDKADIDLAGTLTIPEGKGPFSAAVLITGSGAQNRHEELMGHKPFLVIADWLTRNGIAVLRYDDRGVGKSKGNYPAATTADFAGDAAAALRFLRSDPRINPKAAGLIGHSEGGLVAPIVASTENVSFIVSLAGTGVPGDRIIYRQSADISRAAGLDENAIEDAVSLNRQLFSILKIEKDNQAASEKMLQAYKEIAQQKNATAAETEQGLQQLKNSLNPSTLTWLRYFISTNPAPYWKNVKCPVLALNGEKDLQVAADENLDAIAKALKSGGNKSVTTRKLPELNHLFQHSKTGAPSEYSTIEETFSPEVLGIISDWINGLKL